MPLLKLSKDQYIATEPVVEWKIAYEVRGLITNERRLYGYTAPDEGYSICLTDPNEIDALLRWLDANATDIMANPQPAPADAPPPETRKYEAGDKVRVTKQIAEEDAPYVGTTGIVWESESYGSCFVRLDDNRRLLMLSEQIELATLELSDVGICVGDDVGIIGTKLFGEVTKTEVRDGTRFYFLIKAYNFGVQEPLGWFSENMLDPENNAPTPEELAEFLGEDDD